VGLSGTADPTGFQGSTGKRLLLQLCVYALCFYVGWATNMYYALLSEDFAQCAAACRGRHAALLRCFWSYQREAGYFAMLLLVLPRGKGYFVTLLLVLPKGGSRKPGRLDCGVCYFLHALLHIWDAMHRGHRPVLSLCQVHWATT
jgi:hypothetical protein